MCVIFWLGWWRTSFGASGYSRCLVTTVTGSSTPGACTSTTRWCPHTEQLLSPLTSLYIAGSPRLASSHRGRHLVRSPCGRPPGGHSAHRPRAPPDGLPRQHHLGVVPRHQLPHHHGPLRLPPPPAEVKRGTRVPPPGSKHGSGDWQLITLHLQAGHGNYGNWGRVMDTVHGTDQRFLSSIEHSRDRRLLGLTPVNRTTKAEQD